jgi:hypothetical protein
MRTAANTVCIEASLRDLRERNQYEKPLYWCHQLFFPEWDAGGPLQILDEKSGPDMDPLDAPEDSSQQGADSSTTLENSITGCCPSYTHEDPANT